jgi:CRP-like cAMP-binding protein
MQENLLHESKHGECVEYAAGEVIYYAGHQPYGVYHFAEGDIRLTGRRGVRSAEIGEILGLKACLAGKPHDETARCLAPTRVYFICRRDF